MKTYDTQLAIQYVPITTAAQEARFERSMYLIAQLFVANGAEHEENSIQSAVSVSAPVDDGAVPVSPPSSPGADRGPVLSTDAKFSRDGQSLSPSTGGLRAVRVRGSIHPISGRLLDGARQRPVPGNDPGQPGAV